jgi:hypothetical protein
VRKREDRLAASVTGTRTHAIDGHQAQEPLFFSTHSPLHCSPGAIPASRLIAQTAVLNAAYNAYGFSFVLHEIIRHTNDAYYQGCFTKATEIAMKNEYAVDPTKFLNFYTCSPAENILGYATFPEDYPESSKLHGVVVLDETLPGGSAAPTNLGDTGTHEVGHYLGMMNFVCFRSMDCSLVSAGHSTLHLSF